MMLLSKQSEYKVYSPIFTKHGYAIMRAYTTEGLKYKFKSKFGQEPMRLEIFEVGKGYVPVA